MKAIVVDPAAPARLVLADAGALSSLPSATVAWSLIERGFTGKVVFRVVVRAWYRRATAAYRQALEEVGREADRGLPRREGQAWEEPVDR